MVPWFVRLRPFVGDVIVLSSIVVVVRMCLVRVSSEGEASDWEVSIGFCLGLFLCSFVEAIKVVSFPFVFVVVFSVVLIPKKCVIHPLGGGIDRFLMFFEWFYSVVQVVLCLRFESIGLPNHHNASI